jgi:outer membrane protein TolC
MKPISIAEYQAWGVRSALQLAALTGLALGLCGLVPSLRAEVCTLDKALATAEAQSPDAKIARHRIEGARAMIDQANAAWMPQVMVQGRYTQTNSSMMAFGSILNQRTFSYALDFNHPGRVDDLNASGTVAYNVYAGGRAKAGREAARAGSRAAEQDLQAVRNQLGAEVLRSYLNIRKAHEGVVALEAGVKAYDAGIAAARLRYDAGQLLKADLLSLEVQLSQTREMLSSARHGEALARRAFLFVLGQEGSGESVELAQEDPSLARVQSPDTHDFSRRPELLGLAEREKAAEAMVRVARGGRQPTVNAFASYQYSQGWQMDAHADGWMAGLTLDLNVWDGGQTSGKVRQALAELSQVREMTRKATLGIGLEVEQARLVHEDCLERLAVSEQAVAQAEEAASLSRARFEKGALLVAELIGVESRLIEVRMRRMFALADERSSLADLRRAVGLPILN